MNFKWLKAKNFLSIGEEGIHIVFDELGKIVVIKGINLDISPRASNGSGKSTVILESLTYGFFGKVVKNLAHKEVINKKTKKGLEIEVCFEIGGSEYRIIRKRKPDALYLFKDGDDITLGGMPATQAEIERIVRFNYEAFINVVCFGEHNNHAFLSCDAATKRVIVENLLGLEKYLKYSKTAKDALKAIKERLTVRGKEYETLVNQKSSLGTRIDQLNGKRNSWILARENEINNLKVAIANKEKEIATSSDDGNDLVLYQQAQARLKENKDKLVKHEEDRVKMTGLLDEIKKKLEEVQNAKNDLSFKIKEKDSEIAVKNSQIKILDQQNSKMKGLQPGVTCNACFGTVEEKNYAHMLAHNQSEIEKIRGEVESINSEKTVFSEKLNTIVGQFNSVNQTKTQVDARLSQITARMKAIMEAIQTDSKVKEPQSGVKALLLAEQLSELNRRLSDKLNEADTGNPYEEMLTSARKEYDQVDTSVSGVKTLIEEDEAWLPYYEFWIEGFGDDGIRAFIIDDILPALNARINYWLQFLIDNKIQLTFDNKFEATIQRNPVDGDPFVYNATSGGEKRRINLAISQAFAYVTMVSANVSPNICLLDEVCLNVDTEGALGIFNMLTELSKDRQIFVTTHDTNLNDLLQSCDVLTVVKKDGWTTIQKSNV